MKFGVKRLITTAFLAFAICNFARATVLNFLPADTLRVHVKIVATEKKPENYDSLYHSLPLKKIHQKSTDKTMHLNRVSRKINTAVNQKKPVFTDTVKTKGGTTSPSATNNPAGETSSIPVTTNISPKTADTTPLAAPANIPRTAREREISVSNDRKSSYSAPDTEMPQNPRANRISYLWIGFVLVIGGIVLGLIFGRAAFMVSIIGVVFLLIGFYIRQ